MPLLKFHPSYVWTCMCDYLCVLATWTPSGVTQDILTKWSLIAWYNVVKLLSVSSDSMVLRRCSWRNYCCVRRCRLWQFDGGGNKQFADLDKSLIIHCNSINLDEECLWDEGSFETPQKEIALKKRTSAANANIFYILYFFFNIVIIIVIIILVCRIS